MEFFHCQLGGGIGGGADAQGDKGFQQVEAEGLFIEHLGFEISHGNHPWCFLKIYKKRACSTGTN